MTEVFLDYSQPLEAISRHIHTVAGEPEWSVIGNVEVSR